MRGGERCLEVVCELFPDAPLFTLLHVPGTVSPVIERRRVVTSFVQRLPAAAAHYRRYLPLFPAAVRRFDLSRYDLVLSLSHCVAKGVRTPPGALHLCYCFTPMRYVWDLAQDYLGARAGLATRLLAPPVAAALRRWDRRTQSVHGVVAISRHIAERIRRVWGREADVIHPPVDVDRFRIADRVDDYYLVVSALVPYKRIDLAIGAARRLGRRLVIVGAGPEDRRLRALAGPGIEFLGWRDDREVADLYARCRAVLFPAVEDFGIVPLEAAAAGRPTIALGRGGVLETMVGLESAPASGHPRSVPGAQAPMNGAAPTAVFFREQTVEALTAAIRAFEAAADRFDPEALRARAREFDRPVFKRRFSEYVDARWREFRARQAC
ncbi:MAG: glycosyl transferase family 1 [Candidatus Rokubacteria bacterium 13_1_20CM_4_70_14]|nr:MAG: glycosyl transferase family 1 [Candidatus Rokubacteria bacterium 13_1_20CM_4_70_14]